MPVARIRISAFILLFALLPAGSFAQDAAAKPNRQRPYHLDYAISQQVIGVLDRAAPQNVAGIQGGLHTMTFEIACLPGKPEATLEHRSDFLMQYQVGAKQLQSALGKGLIVHSDAQSHLPPDVKISPLLGFFITHLVMRLQQEGSSQHAGRHTIPPIIRAASIS